MWLPTGGQSKQRAVFRVAMLFARGRANAGDHRSITQSEQAHRRPGVLRVAVLFLVAGEQDVIPVRRNTAAINMTAFFRVNEAALFSLAVGHPKLSPFVWPARINDCP